jgi:hypothetical protein
MVDLQAQPASTSSPVSSGLDLGGHGIKKEND